ncbi:MAG: hypothetical protein GXO26_04915 [Crenarchaeota archaeon]|nr:hypothetical protein [Thermoproteota archaeon]
MSAIRVYGIAVFDLRKDPDVVLLELQIAGVKNIVEVESLPEEYLKHIENVEKEFRKYLPSNLQTLDYIAEISKKSVLIRLYIDEEGKAVRVLILSFGSGALRHIVKRLERFGWNRVLLFEIRKLARKASADY